MLRYHLLGPDLVKGEKAPPSDGEESEGSSEVEIMEPPVKTRK